MPKQSASVRPLPKGRREPPEAKWSSPSRNGLHRIGYRVDQMSSRPLGFSAEELLRQDRWLRDLVRSLVGESDVDDVVQDTWASALGRGEMVERPRAWLSVVAGNFVRRTRRSMHLRSQREEVAARPEATPSTEHTLELLELQQHVMRSVRELREPYRTTVLMRFTHGLSMREIAARTGVSEAGVRQRLKRGLDSLRAELGARCGDDWRDMPGLVFWLIPGVVQMKKATLIAAGLVLAASMGTLVVMFERPVDSSGGGADAPAEEVLALAPEAVNPEPEVAQPETEARAPVVTPDTRAPGPITTIDFTGRVLDVLGRPLGGVGIVPTPDYLSTISSDGIERFAAATSTAGDGTFRLTVDLEQSEIVTDAAWVPVAVSSSIKGGPGDPGDVLLVVAPAIEMAGAVSDPDGAPLSGVRISVARAELNDFGSALTNVRRIDWLDSATDEAGRFDRRDLPAKLGRLRFEKEGYVTREIDIGEFDARDLWVTLESDDIAYVVTGWVLAPNGAPIEGALVGLGDRTTRTALGGAFELRTPGEQAPEGRDALWAASPPWRTKVVEGVGAALQEDADKALEYEIVFDGEALAIGGRVVDADGEPVEGVEVYIWRQRELMTGLSAEELAVPEEREQLSVGPGLRVWSKTDAEGRFRIDGLSATEYRLRLLDRERFAARTTEPIRAGALDVMLTLPNDFVRARVTGHVVDRSGKGVSGVTITPQLGVYLSTNTLTSEGNGRKFETDGEGSFTLTDVSGSDLMLSLYGKSIMPMSHFIREGDPVKNIEILVDPMCHFRLVLTGELESATGLRVLDAAGEPMNVAALGGGEYSWSTWRWFEGGRTRVLSVGQSAATLVLYDDSHTEVDRLPIALHPGEVNSIDL